MRVVRLLSILLLAACAGRPSPVTVLGTETDLSALDGSWSGEYWGSGNGHSGSIVFELRVEDQVASGDVVMVPRGADRPLHQIHDRSIAESEIPTTQVIGIRFVRIDGGRVSGEMEPYHGPDCDCALLTRFTGAMRADTISGTYLTTGGHEADRRTGEWRVVRRR